MKFCKVKDGTKYGCDRSYYAKGYCKAHYQRWWREADPYWPPIRTKGGAR